jgi:hypothetical protein
MAAPITRTLLIMAEPLAKILSGQKVWEVRRRRTRFLGERIGLSESGANRIVATCTIIENRGPLTYSEVIKNARRMGHTRAGVAHNPGLLRQIKERKLYVWVLANVRKLRKPVAFKNPPGAVIFAKVPLAVARRASG